MENERSNCTEETCCQTAAAIDRDDSRAPNAVAWVRPHHEVDRSDESFRLRVYVPGSNKSNINLAIDEGVLTLTAKRSDAAAENWIPLSRQLDRRDYRLEVRIPDKVDAGGISASVEDGILLLTLPIRDADKPRTIEVQ